MSTSFWVGQTPGFSFDVKTHEPVQLWGTLSIDVTEDGIGGGACETPGVGAEKSGPTDNW